MQFHCRLSTVTDPLREQPSLQPNKPSAVEQPTVRLPPLAEGIPVRPTARPVAVAVADPTGLVLPIQVPTAPLVIVLAVFNRMLQAAHVWVRHKPVKPVLLIPKADAFVSVVPTKGVKYLIHLLNVDVLVLVL